IVGNAHLKAYDNLLIMADAVPVNSGRNLYARATTKITAFAGHIKSETEVRGTTDVRVTVRNLARLTGADVRIDRKAFAGNVDLRASGTRRAIASKTENEWDRLRRNSSMNVGSGVIFDIGDAAAGIAIDIYYDAKTGIETVRSVGTAPDFYSWRAGDTISLSKIENNRPGRLTVIGNNNGIAPNTIYGQQYIPELVITNRTEMNLELNAINLYNSTFAKATINALHYYTPSSVGNLFNGAYLGVSEITTPSIYIYSWGAGDVTFSGLVSNERGSMYIEWTEKNETGNGDLYSGIVAIGGNKDGNSGTIQLAPIWIHELEVVNANNVGTATSRFEVYMTLRENLLNPSETEDANIRMTATGDVWLQLTLADIKPASVLSGSLSSAPLSGTLDIESIVTLGNLDVVLPSSFRMQYLANMKVASIIIPGIVQFTSDELNLGNVTLSLAELEFYMIGGQEQEFYRYSLPNGTQLYLDKNGKVRRMVAPDGNSFDTSVYQISGSVVTFVELGIRIDLTTGILYVLTRSELAALLGIDEESMAGNGDINDYLDYGFDLYVEWINEWYTLQGTVSIQQKAEIFGYDFVEISEIDYEHVDDILYFWKNEGGNDYYFVLASNLSNLTNRDYPYYYYVLVFRQNTDFLVGAFIGLRETSTENVGATRVNTFERQESAGNPDGSYRITDYWYADFIYYHSAGGHSYRVTLRQYYEVRYEFNSSNVLQSTTTIYESSYYRQEILIDNVSRSTNPSHSFGVNNGSLTGYVFSIDNVYYSGPGTPLTTAVLTISYIQFVPWQNAFPFYGSVEMIPATDDSPAVYRDCFIAYDIEGMLAGNTKNTRLISVYSVYEFADSRGYKHFDGYPFIIESVMAEYSMEEFLISGYFNFQYPVLQSMGGYIHLNPGESISLRSYKYDILGVSKDVYMITSDIAISRDAEVIRTHKQYDIQASGDTYIIQDLEYTQTFVYDLRKNIAGWNITYEPGYTDQNGNAGVPSSTVYRPADGAFAGSLTMSGMQHLVRLTENVAKSSAGRYYYTDETLSGWVGATSVTDAVTKTVTVSYNGRIVLIIEEKQVLKDDGKVYDITYHTVYENGDPFVCVGSDGSVDWLESDAAERVKVQTVEGTVYLLSLLEGYSVTLQMDDPKGSIHDGDTPKGRIPAGEPDNVDIKANGGDITIISYSTGSIGTFEDPLEYELLPPGRLIFKNLMHDKEIRTDLYIYIVNGDLTLDDHTSIVGDENKTVEVVIGIRDGSLYGDDISVEYGKLLIHTNVLWPQFAVGVVDIGPNALAESPGDIIFRHLGSVFSEISFNANVISSKGWGDILFDAIISKESDIEFFAGGVIGIRDGEECGEYGDRAFIKYDDDDNNSNSRLSLAALVSIGNADSWLIIDIPEQLTLKIPYVGDIFIDALELILGVFNTDPSDDAIYDEVKIGNKPILACNLDIITHPDNPKINEFSGHIPYAPEIIKEGDYLEFINRQLLQVLNGLQTPEEFAAWIMERAGRDEWTAALNKAVVQLLLGKEDGIPVEWLLELLEMDDIITLLNDDQIKALLESYLELEDEDLEELLNLAELAKLLTDLHLQDIYDALSEEQLEALAELRDELGLPDDTTLTLEELLLFIESGFEFTLADLIHILFVDYLTPEHLEELYKNLSDEQKEALTAQREENLEPDDEILTLEELMELIAEGFEITLRDLMAMIFGLNPFEVIDEEDPLYVPAEIDITTIDPGIIYWLVKLMLESDQDIYIQAILDVIENDDGDAVYELIFGDNGIVNQFDDDLEQDPDVNEKLPFGKTDGDYVLGYETAMKLLVRLLEVQMTMVALVDADDEPVLDVNGDQVWEKGVECFTDLGFYLGSLLNADEIKELYYAAMRAAEYPHGATCDDPAPRGFNVEIGISTGITNIYCDGDITILVTGMDADGSTAGSDLRIDTVTSERGNVTITVANGSILADYSNGNHEKDQGYSPHHILARDITLIATGSIGSPSAPLLLEQRENLPTVLANIDENIYLDSDYRSKVEDEDFVDDFINGLDDFDPWLPEKEYILRYVQLVDENGDLLFDEDGRPIMGWVLDVVVVLDWARVDYEDPYPRMTLDARAGIDVWLEELTGSVRGSIVAGRDAGYTVNDGEVGEITDPLHVTIGRTLIINARDDISVYGHGNLTMIGNSETGQVNAIVENNLHLSNTNGQDLIIGPVISLNGDVTIIAAADLVEGNRYEGESYGAYAQVTGTNITLMAANGIIGTLDNPFDIDTRSGLGGMLTAYAKSMVINEISDDLIIWKAEATEGDIVLIAPDSILDGSDAGKVLKNLLDALRELDRLYVIANSDQAKANVLESIAAYLEDLLAQAILDGTDTAELHAAASQARLAANTAQGVADASLQAAQLYESTVELLAQLAVMYVAAVVTPADLYLYAGNTIGTSTDPLSVQVDGIVNADGPNGIYLAGYNDTTTLGDLITDCKIEVTTTGDIAQASDLISAPAVDLSSLYGSVGSPAEAIQLDTEYLDGYAMFFFNVENAGDLTLGYVHAASIILTVNGDLTVDDSLLVNLTGGIASLTVDGTVGSITEPLKSALMDALTIDATGEISVFGLGNLVLIANSLESQVNAESEANLYLANSNAQDLILGLIIAGGNAVIFADGDMLEGDRYGADTTVTAIGISLYAMGDIGKPSNPLDIDTQADQGGWLSAVANNVYINEVFGDLVVLLVQALTGDVVITVPDGSIFDGTGSGALIKAALEALRAANNARIAAEQAESQAKILIDYADRMEELLQE
ncbi:MAG: hypothetical protein FWD45_04560, partial [Coriobacteriia bacterium]|nr:hypothetical protein [Coriobacteriia bacterium]